MDTIGRSIGLSSSKDGADVIDKYVMRVTNYSVCPSIFFAWLNEKSRPTGNTPDLLTTKIEGYLLNIGIATTSSSVPSRLVSTTSPLNKVIGSPSRVPRLSDKTLFSISTPHI